MTLIQMMMIVIKYLITISMKLRVVSSNFNIHKLRILTVQEIATLHRLDHFINFIDCNFQDFYKFYLGKFSIIKVNLVCFEYYYFCSLKLIDCWKIVSPMMNYLQIFRAVIHLNLIALILIDFSNLVY
jgi:hypothetical protein